MTDLAKLTEIAMSAAASQQLDLATSVEESQLSPEEQSDIFLFVASELVATAAQMVSRDNPGIPVVELLLLSKRIASLTKSGVGVDDDA